MDRNGIDSMKAKSLIWNTYGLLTVVSLHSTRPYPSGGTRRMWRCRCDCGAETIVAGNNLTNGHTTSCGAKYHHKNHHGKSGTQLYHVWENMLRRCNSPNHPSYADYGGRGITVCREWLNFMAFSKDMSEGWMEGLVIDRADNNGGYCKKNCRWVTTAESSLNKRSTVRWEWNGKVLTAKEWSEMSSLSANQIYSRLIHGWSVKDAIEKPMRNYPRKTA